jgi:hypothetical protein
MFLFKKSATRATIQPTMDIKTSENELQIYAKLFTVLYTDDTILLAEYNVPTIQHCWQNMVNKHLALKINHSPTRTHTVGTLQHQLC